MKIDIKDESLYVTLTGRLDIKNANDTYKTLAGHPSFEAAIKQTDDVSNGIIFNMLDLQYVSSAGLRIIVLIAKKAHPKKVKVICDENGAVFKLLTLSGVSSFMDIDFRKHN